MKETLFSNIAKGLRLRFNQLLNNPYRPLGLSSFQVKLLKNSPDHKLHKINLINRQVIFYNAREFLYGVNEIFLHEIYKINLPEDSYIIDCGAHIGLSVLYFNQLHPSSRILAFEPDKKNYELLCENTKSLTCIELRNEAVWIEDCRLNFSNEGNMSSKIVAGETPNDTSVKATRLKNFINKKVDFLKIDIEGAEYEVLKDIQDNLHLVENVFIEYHGSFEQNSELNEIFSILTSHRFKYYIKEATSVYNTPYYREEIPSNAYDVQLNIFAFKH